MTKLVKNPAEGSKYCFNSIVDCVLTAKSLQYLSEYFSFLHKNLTKKSVMALPDISTVKTRFNVSLLFPARF